MVYRGRVEHGVIVLDQDVHLPDGTAVKVEPVIPVAPSAGDAVYRLTDFAALTGVPDLAQNIDHYLYGHPKASHGGQ